MAKSVFLSRAEMIRRSGFEKSDESIFESDEYPKRGIYDDKQVEAWYPVNPITGLAQNDMSRYTSPFITEQERTSILSRLSVLRADYADKEFTDEELFSLLPPRYLNDDAVDIGLWRDYLQNHVLVNGEQSDSDNVSTGEVGNADTSNETSV